MNWLVSKLYDRFMAPAEAACLRSWRAELLAGLSGEVLEIGAGTGANVGLYPSGLTGLTLVEPDANMRRILRGRAAGARISEASVEDLGLPDGSVDAVVSTLVLCSVPDLDIALAEIHRVLKPGGRLVFLEHVAHPDPRVRTWQRRVEPLWRRVADGCRLTRCTDRHIVGAGFSLEALRREPMCRAPELVRSTVRGVATKPG